MKGKTIFNGERPKIDQQFISGIYTYQVASIAENIVVGRKIGVPVAQCSDDLVIVKEQFK
jgi:hypothetical protein